MPLSVRDTSVPPVPRARRRHRAASTRSEAEFSDIDFQAFGGAGSGGVRACRERPVDRVVTHEAGTAAYQTILMQIKFRRLEPLIQVKRWIRMDEIGFLRREAEECRRAASDLAECDARRGLEQLARHYEREARRLNVIDDGAKA